MEISQICLTLKIVLRPSNHPPAAGSDQSQCQHNPPPDTKFSTTFSHQLFPPPPNKLAAGLAKFIPGFCASDPGGFSAENDVIIAPTVSEGGTELKAQTDTIIRGGNSKANETVV